MPDEEVGIAEFILKGLINGALGKAGGEGFGEITNLLLGGGSSGLSDMQSQIGQLKDELGAMRTDLEDMLQQLEKIAEQQQWGRALKTVDDIQIKVDSIFDDLKTAKPGDKSVPDEVVQWVQANNTDPLVAVHYLMMPNKLIAAPFVGMLSLFSSTALLNAQGSYQKDDFGPGSRMDLDYRSMEKYFRSLIGLQIQIATLLVNGYTQLVLPDRVASTLVMLQKHLAEQCDAFLWSVESYVVGYCVDDTLFSLFRRAAFEPDPIRRADLFANNYLYAPDQDVTLPGAKTIDVFRVRVWGATSTDGSLSTLTFVPLGNNQPDGFVIDNGSGFALQGGGTNLSPTASWRIVFPAANNKQWSLYRHTFLEPPAGVWTIAAPPTDAVGAFNVVVDSYSYDCVYNGPTSSLSSGLWYTFGDDTRASEYHVTLTARTALSLQGSAYGAVQASYDFRNSITFEAWVRNPSPGAFVCTAMRHDSGDSAGVFILGLDTYRVPYALMSVLWTGTDEWGNKEQKTQHNLTTMVGPGINDSNWHQVAASLDHHTGTITLFLDGQPVPTMTDGDVEGGMGDGLYFDEVMLLIGIPSIDATYLADNGFSFQGAFANGEYSEVRVWPGWESAQVIADSYRRRITSGSYLLGLWNLDFGSFADRAAGNPITLQQGGTFVPMPQPDWLSLPAMANAWEGGHQSLSDISVAELNGTLYLVYRDGANALAVQSSSDGRNWTALPQSAPIYLFSSPVLVPYGESLALAYRTNDGTNSLGYALSGDGRGWTTNVVAGVSFRGTPGFFANCASEFPPMCFRAFDGGNLLWEVFGDPIPVPSITLQGDPSGYVCDDGSYFVAFRANDPSHVLYLAASGNTSDLQRGWPVSGPDGAYVTLNGSPSMSADVNGLLWIAFRWGDEVRIASITKANASVQGPVSLTAASVATVTYPVTNGQAVTSATAHTTGNPSLMISGSTMFLAFRDRDDSQTYWIMTSADGTVWSPPVRIATRWEQIAPRSRAAEALVTTG
jgi:hypothetical protein